SSTLMTSAPRSPSRAPHQGPAMTRERSITRMPSSARGKVVMGATIPRPRLTNWGLLNDLIGLAEQRLRDRQPERLRGLEVDDQLESRWLLDGQVAGFGALENLVHVGCSAPRQIGRIRSIGHEAPGIDIPPERVDGRQSVPCRQVHEAF